MGQQWQNYEPEYRVNNAIATDLNGSTMAELRAWMGQQCHRYRPKWVNNGRIKSLNRSTKVELCKLKRVNNSRAMWHNSNQWLIDNLIAHGYNANLVWSPQVFRQCNPSVSVSVVCGERDGGWCSEDTPGLIAYNLIHSYHLVCRERCLIFQAPGYWMERSLVCYRVHSKMCYVTNSFFSFQPENSFNYDDELSRFNPFKKIALIFLHSRFTKLFLHFYWKLLFLFLAWLHSAFFISQSKPANLKDSNKIVDGCWLIFFLKDIQWY